MTKVHFRRFLPEDYAWMMSQPTMAFSRPDPKRAYELANQPNNYTCVVDGGIIACAGVIPYHHDRAEVWFLPGINCGKYMLPITRAILPFLDLLPYKRLEAAVELGFAPGHRWVKKFGFKKEADFCEAYNPDGTSVSLYSRIRRDF